MQLCKIKIPVNQYSVKEQSKTLIKHQLFPKYRWHQSLRLFEIKQPYGKSEIEKHHTRKDQIEMFLIL